MGPPVTAARQHAAIPRRKGRLQLYRQHKYLLILFFPALVYYILFRYVPLYGIQIAFKNFIFRRGIWGSPWIGFEHFVRLFGMRDFWNVFRNTLIISSLKFLFGFPAPILFALLINEVRNTAYKKTVQTISYLPHFLSWVVLGGLFLQFLSPSIGPINAVLREIGIKPIYFLASPKWFRSVLVATSIWKGVGWSSVIYLAALTGVDPSLYEAATMDGAGRLRRTLHITLPSIAPVITIQMIFAMRGIVGDDFDQIFNLYNPAVYKVADVLSTYVYRVGLVDMQYSFSTAVGLFRNVVAFVFIVGANAVARRVNDYGLW